MNDLELLRVRAMLARRRIFDLVHVAEVGSTIYGTGVGADDLDVTAVWMEDLRELVSPKTKRQSMMVRTKPDQEPSEPGDIDINVYTLRKFAFLAAKGNPSILTALYSPNAATRVDLDPLRKYVRSKRAGQAYLGYLQSQRSKLHFRTYPSRQNLVDEHGYDTKSAYHAVRLGWQGVEYVNAGELTIPFSLPEASTLVAIRNGRFTLTDVGIMIDRAIADLEEAIEYSSLPEKPDIVGLEHWLKYRYLAKINDFWEGPKF